MSTCSLITLQYWRPVLLCLYTANGICNVMHKTFMSVCTILFLYNEDGIIYGFLPLSATAVIQKTALLLFTEFTKYLGEGEKCLQRYCLCMLIHHSFQIMSSTFIVYAYATSTSWAEESHSWESYNCATPACVWHGQVVLFIVHLLCWQNNWLLM